MSQLPTATLRVMYAMTNPPKPLGADVRVGDVTVAVVTADELRRAADSLDAYKGATVKIG